MTRSSAATVPVIVTADSAVSAETASLRALGGSSLGSTTWAIPVSSRTITNWTFFWSRIACTQPRTVAGSPTFSRSPSTSVRSTSRTLSELWQRGAYGVVQTCQSRTAY